MKKGLPSWIAKKYGIGKKAWAIYRELLRKSGKK
jgi:hypothetical protein